MKKSGRVGAEYQGGNGDMKDYCPVCNDEREIERIAGKEAVEVRGERFEVESEYFRCGTCGEEFEAGDSPLRPVEEAYRLYREKHGMVTPEEIREYRKRYGLSQRELSMILGWGGATLSRYENGALQDEAHDRMLRLAMNPANLLDLVERSGANLPPRKKAELIDRIRAEVNVSGECEMLLGRFTRPSTPDIFNGYRRFDSDRMKQAILFFTRRPRFTTVLNKLLFCADFAHFREQGISITGSRYAHLPYGPTPDNYRFIFDSMVAGGDVRVEEIIFSEPDVAGEKYRAAVEPDMEVFSRSEREVLEFVEKTFGGFTATRISELSHEVEGYKKTVDGEVISYEYAEGMGR